MKGYAQAQALIRAGAKWSPGAWTPARCALWNANDPETRQRLETWVIAERERAKCHSGQLPKLEGQ